MIGIYMIENLVNNKKYIGKTIDYKHRVYLHKHDLKSNNHVNRHLQNAWNKYGYENFKFSLILDITNWSKDKDRLEIDEHLNNLEKEFIEMYKSSNAAFGYNMSEGGDGATLFGERNPTYGKKRSKETRTKISNTIIKNKSHSGENNGRYGKPVSIETRAKISKSNSGRVQSESERAKRSNSMQKYFSSDEFKKKMDLRKNDPEWKKRCEEIGKSKRKYTDEFVAEVRNAYLETPDMKYIAEKFNLRYKLCVEMVNKNGHFKNR